MIAFKYGVNVYFSRIEIRLRDYIIIIFGFVPHMWEHGGWTYPHCVKLWYFYINISIYVYL